MKIAPLPTQEQERLEALSEYNILDTLPETDFDDITRIASEICQSPISLVTLIDTDRQWFKSHHGLDITETSRDQSFCAHALLQPNKTLIIPDTAADERFAGNPLVTGQPHIAAYAGVPLLTKDGLALGTLCVMDQQPREWVSGQLENLQALARQVSNLLELRKTAAELKESEAALKGAYKDLETFSFIASHDLKSPLNNIISLTHLLKDGYEDRLDDEGREYIAYLNESAYQLSDMVSGILNYSKSSHLLTGDKEAINLPSLMEEVISLLRIPPNTTINYPKEVTTLQSSYIALKQILLNLVHNAIKYNDKKKCKIDILYKEEPTQYTFEVRDNGPGVAEENKDKIFVLFERLDNKNQDGESLGIGLSIVKRLVEKLGGGITVESKLGKGTSFIFTLAR